MYYQLWLKFLKAMLGTASTLNVWAETKKTIINYSLLKLKIMTTNKFKIIAIAVVCYWCSKL
jgi:hypothetical protein